jgi:hypothetical protein
MFAAAGEQWIPTFAGMTTGENDAVNERSFRRVVE